MDQIGLNSHLTTGGDDHFLPKLIHSINHASQIDIAVAFIRSTGLSLLQSALVDALNSEIPAKIRIITGDYLEITEPYALRRLMILKELGADIKIFETKGNISFHMKAYIFTYARDDMQGSAFIGSSNISGAALKSGLEWNLKVNQSENKLRFKEITKKFNLLFENEKAVNLSQEWIDSYQHRYDLNHSNKHINSETNDIEIPPEPYPIQLDALEALSNTRAEGFTRGLVVLATGMGKTWLAAFDVKAMNAKRVLFVAHREEILFQAEETFLRIKPDCKVGRYTGIKQQLNADFIFASIQTLGKLKHLKEFRNDYFDYIIVDEFHHAAARTYQQLLNHFTPRFLLGLTATPERTDQSDILSLCDDNLVYRKDLFEGINSKILSPFKYYGIGDEHVDYTEIPWRSGKFVHDDLLNQLATQARAKHVLNIWKKHKQTRTLAFCISKKHADFMAEYFNKNGVSSASVHSDSKLRRNEAIEDLVSKNISILFSVDLFNEGVDIPSIDTILMLRPTESKIIFLQQFGRGLRLCSETNKTNLTVIDFIGNHISFFRKIDALFNIGVTNQKRRQFLDDITNEGLEIPDGCFVNYDVIAIDFLNELIKTKIDSQESIYRSLKEGLSRRPTMTEFYNAGGTINTVRQEYGQWHSFVDKENDLTLNEKTCFEINKKILSVIETTQLSKSFKMILIETYLELDGFINPPTLTTLAKKSLELLHRRREFLKEIPEQFSKQKLQDSTLLEKQWLTYWNKNPVNAWIGGNTKSISEIFTVKEDKLVFNEEIEITTRDEFYVLVQEIVNYRLIQYASRNSFNSETELKSSQSTDDIQIPYFGDLKIACGYFKASKHDNERIESSALPISYKNLNSAKLFIARASGKSMEGGRKPIKHGDYLLLEAINSNSISIINDEIIAVEQKSYANDSHYLLRQAVNDGEGKYILNAFNETYEPIPKDESMQPFAMLKQVLDITEVHLHKEMYKHEVAELFGLEYLEGLWKMSGHVCPKDSVDQFLFITLNKQNAEVDYRYHDYFESSTLFHWQSQSKTTPESKKGIGVINSNEIEGSIYIFVRKFGKIRGKGAPFIFCGRLKYLDHTGSAPMNVNFEMQNPLSDELFNYFKM